MPQHQAKELVMPSHQVMAALQHQDKAVAQLKQLEEDLLPGKHQVLIAVTFAIFLVCVAEAHLAPEIQEEVVALLLLKDKEAAPPKVDKEEQQQVRAVVQDRPLLGLEEQVLVPKAVGQLKHKVREALQDKAVEQLKQEETTEERALQEKELEVLSLQEMVLHQGREVAVDKHKVAAQAVDNCHLAADQCVKINAKRLVGALSPANNTSTRGGAIRTELLLLLAQQVEWQAAKGKDKGKPKEMEGEEVQRVQEDKELAVPQVEQEEVPQEVEVEVAKLKLEMVELLPVDKVKEAPLLQAMDKLQDQAVEVDKLALAEEIREVTKEVGAAAALHSLYATCCVSKAASVLATIMAASA
jgi:hypothetical protein